MKNIFKFMAIALVSSSMLFACGDKDNENDNNNNNGDNNGGNNTPTASYKITWDGQVQNPGFMEAYNSSNTVYLLTAAQAVENDNYVRPVFNFGLDLDSDPQYGCALTAQYSYTIQGNQYSGNSLYPTYVAIDGWYETGYGYTGDWWLNYYDDNWDGAIAGAQFDANTRTLTATVTEQMFNYNDVNDYYETNGIEEPTNEDFLAGLTAAEKKELKLEMTNLVFDAASQK